MSTSLTHPDVPIALLGELDLSLQLGGFASVSKKDLNIDSLRRTDA